MRHRGGSGVVMGGCSFTMEDVVVEGCGGDGKSWFIIHVGGTRCVTWSIDRIIQIHVRITWGVEFIRAIFFIFFFYV